ncbi:MAG: hypothetical protein II930_03830 [Lachnospiraceae bacterium]|nr:hypothetical protein [Lachnospiraceae bacterium]
MKKWMNPFALTGLIFTCNGLIFLILAIIFLVKSGLTPGSGMNIIIIVFGAFGLFFPILGIFLISIPMHRRRLARQVREEGYYIMGEVTGILPDASIRINGRNPYVVHCAYQDIYQDRAWTFRSEPQLDPPDLRPGDQIRIFVKPDDYSIYDIDLESTSSSDGYRLS